MNTHAFLFLSVSILMEVIGTTALKFSDSFTRLIPSLIAVSGYAIAFYCLTIPMKTVPTGIIYAIWSGAGIVLIGLAGWVFTGQKMDAPAVLGMFLILCGVVVINIFSKSVAH